LKDIVYQTTFESAEPLEQERYFSALEAERGWLDSKESPLQRFRRRYRLFTLKGAKSFREFPDLKVMLRPRWFTLYAWLKLELTSERRHLKLQTGMASFTGADAGWGRILWTAMGRAFIYIIPVWLALYILAPWQYGILWAVLSFVLAGLGLIWFEAALIVSALKAKNPDFHFSIERLHVETVRRLKAELDLTVLATAQIDGPGIEAKPPPKSSAASNSNPTPDQDNL